MAQRFWVGGTASWNGTAGAKWATLSGGAGGAAEPTAADDVFFDAASGAVVVTIDTSAALCKNLDATGFTGTLTGSTTGLTISGSLTLVAGMTYSYTGAITFNGAGANTITSAGKSLNSVAWNGTGSWLLQDTMTASGACTLTQGTLDLNGQTCTVLTFAAGGAVARGIKSSVSGGKIRTTSVAATSVWNATGSNLTIDRVTGSWTIEIGGNTANIRTFAGLGLTYPTLTITNTTPAGQVTISGNNTFKSLSYTGGVATTIAFVQTSTNTIEDNNGFPSGTAGNLVTIKSNIGAAHNLVKSGGGSINSQYLSISSSQASPASTWYAGPTSTDGGSNTGWIFADASATVFDGSGLKRKSRRVRRAEARRAVLHPQEIARQQREDARYEAQQKKARAKAEAEKAALEQPPAELAVKPGQATPPVATEPKLADAVARAASVELSTLTAREVAAQQAEHRRRLALLLLVD